MISNYSIHPAANLFPIIDKSEFVDLVDNIRRNGLISPILRYEGQIIDGRNRLRACLEANVEPKFEDVSVDNPWEFVWSLNAERRHLQPGQRAVTLLLKQQESAAFEEKKAKVRESANVKRSSSATGNKNAAKKNSAGPCDPALFLNNVEGNNESRDDEPISETSGVTKQKKPSRPSGSGKQQTAKEAKVSTKTATRAESIVNSRPDLAIKVRDGEISLNEALRLKKRSELHEVPVIDGKYRVVYADPPWKYGDSRVELVGTTGAEHHYPTMSIEDLCAMPVKDHVEENAVLFLWVTSPLLEASFRVINSWGFKYKTSFVWDKVKHNMGHYNSVRHEFLLICTRGSCTPDIGELHDSVVEIARSDKHSQKPSYFRELIEKLYVHGNRIELFCREPAAGWVAWGNEAA